MTCPCVRINTIIACTSCGSTQNLRHRLDDIPLEVAKRQSRQCKKCYGTDFEIRETTLDENS